MATLYGKNGFQSWSSAISWSATGSGGADNAGVPAATDDVIFDASYTGTMVVDGGLCCAKTVTVLTGATGTLTYSATKQLWVSGNYTLVSTFHVTGTGTLLILTTATITSGGVVHTGALTFNGSTLFTITLGDNWVVTGLVSNTPAVSNLTLNSYQITCNGGLTVNGAISGTTNFILSGGTWSGASSTGIANNLTLAGNVTISVSVCYKTGTLTYQSGTITVTSSILNITGSCTLNTSGMSWNNLNLTAISTITLASNLSISGIAQFNFSTTFSGNFNISCGYLQMTASATRILILVAGQTLTVTTGFLIGSYGGGVITGLNFQSSTASSPVYLVYQGTQANSNISGAIFTDIDASGSVRKLYNYQGGALTRTVNIENVILPPPVLSKSRLVNSGGM